MPQLAEPFEAVIISGPRRGEIIRLPDTESDINDSDLVTLNMSLDRLSAAIERVSSEIRATIETFSLQDVENNRKC